MISIIIPTYNRISYCLKTIKAILDLKLKIHYEIIVVDDGSKNTPDFSFTDKVKLVINKTNMGRSKSRNIGVKNSTGDILFFIDDDILIEENIFEKHVKSYENNEKIKAVVTNIKNITNDLTNPGILNLYLNTRGINKYNDNDLIPGNYLTTAICSIKRDIFKQISGFDENFNIYGWEDPEIGLSIEKSGGKLTVIKSNKTFHYHDKTISEWINQLEKSGDNFKRLLNKYPEYRERFGYTFFNSFKVKFIFNPIFFNFAKIAISLTPKLIAFSLLRYLFYTSIYKGYRN